MNLALLKNMPILKGAHGSREEGVCMMEAVAWVAGEPHSAKPDCVCPVIGAFMRSWNDGIDDDKERTRIMRPLIKVVIGTKAEKPIQNRRAMMCADWLIRDFTPNWLDLCGDQYQKHTATLRALPEITDWEGVGNATPILVDLKNQAVAAWEAAWGAAREAAWGAAWGAAREAAWGAAKKKLEPISIKMQKSAIAHVKRMCAVK